MRAEASTRVTLAAATFPLLSRTVRAAWGTASLRERLGLSRRHGSPDEPLHSSAMYARTAFYLLVAGSTVTLLSLLFDGGPERDNLAIAAAALAAYPLALLCLVLYDRVSDPLLQVVAAATVALVSVGLYFGGPDSGFYRMFYVWIALFAAYFLRPRAAALQIAAIAVGYALVISFHHTPLGPISWLLTVATLVVIATITALLRRRVEAHLLIARGHNEELREHDRLKDQFLATVSHELRTPLTSIRGYLELTLDDDGGWLSEQQRSFLGIVDRNSDRLLRQVSDLLLVAQIDAGVLAVEKKPVDLAQVTMSAVRGHTAAAEQRGIGLWVDAAEPTVVLGDAERLSQLVDVLVDNAVKFTPTGGTVEVRTEDTPAGAVIEVADSGVGIPPGDQARLFDRFFRAAGVTERAVPGTGLGLTIALGIVHAHGGTIDCTSAEGAGSTFRVLLPPAAV